MAHYWIGENTWEYLCPHEMNREEADKTVSCAKSKALSVYELEGAMAYFLPHG